MYESCSTRNHCLPTERQLQSGKAWATRTRLRNDLVTMRSRDAVVATLKPIVGDGNVAISLPNRASVPEPFV